MIKSKYQNSKSFFGKTRLILVLLGIIPFLLVAYLFVYENMDLTDRIILFSALALFSILTGFSLMRRSADQLVNLSRETGMVETGERSEPVHISADQELNDIANHFNSVLTKLNEANRDVKDQSVQLMIYARDISQSYIRTKEEEGLRNRLSRYVGEHLVEKLISSKNGVFIENERREVTILFADIRSFTTITERMEAEEVVSMLNQFFGIMVDIIFRNNGILDKFVGDELMAVFGLIPSNNSAPYDTIKVAIEMQDATEELMKARAEQDKQTFEIGIGINTGSAIVGNVGSENRMDYTVIGDTVNVAARLEQIAKGGEIIIGEQTHDQAKGSFRIQKKGEISVKNKTEPVICHEVLR
ncbi:MAG: adenylate/guanylate cyclase domain-containing protein [Deltaproteobacteria bacterium]|nr:adenylate/guanylate cyclase domain-containing protein [Deltaproteobacteria bacterium]